MLLFRAEEHVDRRCGQRGVPKGAAFQLAELWRLAQHWYDDRLDHDWRRKSVAERQRILDSIGLTGSFWQIDGE